MKFEFPLYLSIIPIIIGFSILLASYFIFRRTKPAAIIVGLLGIVFLCVFGPMLFMDMVTVDQSGINQVTGFWFDQTHHNLSFDNLSKIVITNENDPKGDSYQVWIVEYKSGDVLKVDPGDLWEMNGDKIAKFAEKHGIRVVRAD